MKHVMLQVACTLLLAGTSAWAEVYETTDSDGNKVFTDTPTGASKIVELQKPNIADGVETSPTPFPPTAPSDSAPPAGPQGSQPENDREYIVGDQYNDRAEDAVARERRREALDGDRPHEALDETRRENGEGDAVRHEERAVDRAVATPHRAVHRR